MDRSRETYTHGHHESVMRSHTWRTVENSANYLLDRLAAGSELLDVGCGPGTITVDFAARVRPGRVVGVDNVEEPLGRARAAANDAGVDNVAFRVADVYSLPFADDSFDIVHAHQVLQHLTDPVAALREMRRVCRAGGTVAARDADYAAMAWYPPYPGLDAWLALYHDLTRGNAVEADAGRRLLSWAREAGFDDVTSSAGTWCFATPEQREWWGGMWADRVLMSTFAEQALARDLASQNTLDQLAQTWRDWAAQPDGWFSVLNGEILCRA